MALPDVIKTLGKLYGPPEPLPGTDPFGLILIENVAYLVDDKIRRAVWNRLKKEIGVRPDQILDADINLLERVIEQGGMHPPMRAEKLRKAAMIAMELFDGDLSKVIKTPKARAALKKFSGIGDPGADKILMITRSEPVLALDSNALRVLLRLGYGRQTSNFAATYKSVQADITAEIKQDFNWLITAHQLLRAHGQSLCRRNKPLCDKCPLTLKCPYFSMRK